MTNFCWRDKDDFRGSWCDGPHAPLRLDKQTIPRLALEAAIALAADADPLCYFDHGSDGVPALFLQCNDVFSPAADAEAVPWEEMCHVRQIYEAGGWQALMGWVAARRKKVSG